MQKNRGQSGDRRSRIDFQLEPKERQALKLAEIREALVTAGYDTTAKQAGVLGLGRSLGTANNGRSGLAINFISVIAISNQSTDRSVPRYHGLGFLPYLSNAATIIAVILFGDDNLDRALTQTAVVVGGLLSVANIHVVQFERLAGAHLFEIFVAFCWLRPRNAHHRIRGEFLSALAGHKVTATPQAESQPAMR